MKGLKREEKSKRKRGLKKLGGEKEENEKNSSDTDGNDTGNVSDNCACRRSSDNKRKATRKS